MHRIRIAHWHNGQPPGSELEVGDEDLAALRRDGRVAEVLPAPDAAECPGPDAPEDQPADVPEPAAAEAEPDPEPSAKTRRRR